MSETSESKTKRKFAKTFLQYDWRYQTTVFLRSYEDRLVFLESIKVIRRAIQQAYPEVSFLWRLILSTADAEYFEDYEGGDKKIVMPAITFFHFARISREEFCDYLESALAKSKHGVVTELYVKGRSLSFRKYHGYARSITTQKPHNFKKYYSIERSPQRYGIIGEEYALKWSDSVAKEKALEA